MHNDWTAHPWQFEERAHFTNWTVSEALRFLRTRDPSVPFFLVVSFIAPHPPLIPPPFYMDRYLRADLPEPHIGDWAEPPPNDGIGTDVDARRVRLTGEALRSCRAAYFGLINHIDDQIRRLLNPMWGVDRSTGHNTIVAFTSDHGEMLGDHYLWRKSLPYEGSARVPLLIRAPDRFAMHRGLVADQPVCLEDIMPTLLDMAGVDIPDSVDGSSLTPLLRGEEPPWRAHVHLECATGSREPSGFHALTDGKEKYVWFAGDGREQFFDLSADPTECRDLSVTSAATERMKPWRKHLIDRLVDRPEGFSDGKELVAGRTYSAVLPRGPDTA
jgi:arylsulfatase A-like enzyme